MAFTRSIQWTDGQAGGTPVSAARLNTAFQEVADYTDAEIAAIASEPLSTKAFAIGMAVAL